MKTVHAKIDQVLRSGEDIDGPKDEVTLILKGEGKEFIGGTDQKFSMRLEVVGKEPLFSKLAIGQRFVITLEEAL